MPGTPSIRVLVLEENPHDQDVLRHELQKFAAGQRVLFLSDPQAVLDLLQGPDAVAFKRDLIAIFLNDQRPAVSGLDLLKLIRATDGMATFPVMIMTASAAGQALAADQKSQATALMEKPVTLGSFSKTLADLFQLQPCGPPA